MTEEICPACGNNLCQIYPPLFAKYHLKPEEQAWYLKRKKELDEWLEAKMADYKSSLEGE